MPLNVDKLDLSDGKLQSVSEEAISRQLRELNLSNNQLTLLPKWVENLKKLRRRASSGHGKARLPM